MSAPVRIGWVQLPSQVIVATSPAAPFNATGLEEYRSVMLEVMNPGPEDAFPDVQAGTSPTAAIIPAGERRRLGPFRNDALIDGYYFFASAPQAILVTPFAVANGELEIKPL